MIYKKYESFKNASASWFTEVPEHWAVVRGKFIFRIKKVIAGSIGHEVLSITNKGIKIKDTESGAGQLSMDYSKYQLVKPGDFAMNHMDLLTGYVDISNYHGVISPDYRTFTLFPKFSEPKFFLYLLQLCYKEKLFFPFGQGSSQLGRWRLPTSSFNDFLYPVPPADERRSIVRYLDNELSKIDILIEKQEKLIELLKEKKQALISHTVSKGLDSRVVLKDSGVKWLGEIPKHWLVGRFKNVVDVRDGTHDTPEYVEKAANTYPLVTSKDLKNGIVSLDKCKHISETDYLAIAKRSFVNTGDILMPMIGTVGGAVIYRLVEKIAIKNIALFKPYKNINSNFFCYCVNADFSREQMSFFSNGGVQNFVSLGVLSNMYLPIPPKKEQERIVDFLNDKTREIDILIQKAEKMVSLLVEKKNSIIFNTVTGKIRVID